MQQWYVTHSLAPTPLPPHTELLHVFVISHKFMSKRAKVAAGSEATGAAAAN